MVVLAKGLVQFLFCPKTIGAFTNKMSSDVVHHTALTAYNEKVVNFYERARPGYVKEAVKLMLTQLGALDHTADREFVILELGAGTGKFTRGMIDILRDQPERVRIIATEPLTAMCNKFREVLPDVEIREGAAENIDLPDCSVNAVVAAQSFHWFADAKSVAEIHRVLVPGGKFGVLWNNRDRSVPWVNEMDEIILPCYSRFNTPSQLTREWKVFLETSEKFGPLQCDNRFKTIQILTRSTLIERVLSISVIEMCTAEEKEIISTKIKAILDKHDVTKDKEEVALPHVVEICWCQKI